MLYKGKYTKEQFLKALSQLTPKSTIDVQLDVGCSKSTAKLFLENLEKERKIIRFKVKGASQTGEVDIWMLSPA